MPPSPSFTSTNQQTFVVQALFDSVTRCFQPCSSRRSEAGATITKQASEPTPVPANADAAAKSEYARHQSPSSTPSTPSKTRQYDADRYIHRKLEIFRTTDEDCIAAFGIPRPRPSSSMRYARKSSSSRSKDPSGRIGSRDRKSNTLVSSSDEEISNLAKNQKRIDDEERENQKKEQSGDFVTSLFRIMQNPLNCITNVDKHYNYSGGGLCFANPVRMAETENFKDLSDWRLTEKEFKAKYPANTADDDIPDVVASIADEEATMTSASYFDQKYSHIVEKNPPIPLFQESLVDVSENNTNGVLKILERRRITGGLTPTRGLLSGGRSTTSSGSPQSSKSSRTPDQIKVKTRSSRFKTGSGSQAKPMHYDMAPIGKSSSVSTSSGDDEKKSSPPISTPTIWQRMCNNSVPDQHQHSHERQQKYCEPEFVYSNDTSVFH